MHEIPHQTPFYDLRLLLLRLIPEDFSKMPCQMDGVPGISYAGIAPGETFTYRFKVEQSSTYWYHSHSGFQELTGMYGAIIVEPAGGDAIRADRDHVVLLSDWTDEDPMRVFSMLKVQSDCSICCKTG